MDLDASDNASRVGAVYHAQHQVRQGRFSDLLSNRFPSLSSTLLSPSSSNHLEIFIPLSFIT